LHWTGDGEREILVLLTDVKGRLGSLFHLPLVPGERAMLGRVEEKASGRLMHSSV